MVSIRTTLLSLLAAAFACTASAREIRLAPDGTNDMTAAVLSAVDGVRGVKFMRPHRFVFAPGDYHFKAPTVLPVYVSNHDTPRPRRIFLPVTNVTDVVLEAPKGARFVCHGEGVAFALMDTTNVTVKGIAFDYARPFFSIWKLKDGRLAEHDPEFTFANRDGVLFATGEGWEDRQKICEFFDKDTKAFRGSVWWDGKADKVFGGHPDGTIAMTRSPCRPNPCVLLYRATRSKFIDSGALAAAGMGFLAQRSTDIGLERWRNRDRRELSLQADATHFSNCRGTVAVVDSVFEGMVDDAINVHSTSLKIVEKSDTDPKRIKCRYMHGQSIGFETFLPGETLRFIKGATFEPGTEVKVTGAQYLDARHVVLTLAKPVPAGYGVGDAVENADWQPRVVFRGNTVRNSSPRATLFTTPGKVVCENNLFENVAGQPLYFAGDAWDWYESGASRDVVIRGNTFRHCGFKSGRGMIMIEPAVHDLAAQKVRYHQNILVEDNTFEDFTLPLVWARSASNVVLRNNKIVNGNSRIVIDRDSAEVKAEESK